MHWICSDWALKNLSFPALLIFISFICFSAVYILTVLYQVWFGHQRPIICLPRYLLMVRRRATILFGSCVALLTCCDHLCGLRCPMTTPVIPDSGDSGHCVVTIRGSLPCLVDIVHALQCDGVGPGGWTVPNVVPVSPPVPVWLDHGAHLAVEIAIWKRDEEASEWHRHVPGEDEDGGKCGCCLLRPNDSDQICDSEERNNDDECFESPQVDVLCRSWKMSIIIATQFGIDNLRKIFISLNLCNKIFWLGFTARIQMAKKKLLASRKQIGIV